MTRDGIMFEPEPATEDRHVVHCATDKDATLANRLYALVGGHEQLAEQLEEAVDRIYGNGHDRQKGVDADEPSRGLPTSLTRLEKACDRIAEAVKALRGVA